MTRQELKAFTHDVMEAMTYHKVHVERANVNKYVKLALCRHAKEQGLNEDQAEELFEPMAFSAGVGDALAEYRQRAQSGYAYPRWTGPKPPVLPQADPADYALNKLVIKYATSY